MGLLWGLAWWFLSNSLSGGAKGRAYGSAWTVLAFVAGFYFGGKHGYGQFHDWINGVFTLNRDEGVSVPINPVIGYLWISACGLGWGGVAGVALSWVGGNTRAAAVDWLIRLVAVIGGGFLGHWLASDWPHLLMPLYGQVDYANLDNCPDCARTTGTLVESTMWLGVWLGGLAAELIRGNRQGAALIAWMGIGFAIAFSAFEWLHLLPDSSPPRWWHFWETSVGAIGGAVIGLCFWSFNRRKGASAGEPSSWASAWELLCGLVLPVLVSIYYVIPFRAARALWFMGWIDKPQESDWREFLSLALAPLLLLAAVIAIAAALRNPKSLESLRLPTISAKMFLWIYLAFFLISVLPRFGLVLTRTGFGWTQVTYLLAFCLTLFAFARAGGAIQSESDKLS